MPRAAHTAAWYASRRATGNRVAARTVARAESNALSDTMLMGDVFDVAVIEEGGISAMAHSIGSNALSSLASWNPAYTIASAMGQDEQEANQHYMHNVLDTNSFQNTSLNEDHLSFMARSYSRKRSGRSYRGRAPKRYKRAPRSGRNRTNVGAIAQRVSKACGLTGYKSWVQDSQTLLPANSWEHLKADSGSVVIFDQGTAVNQRSGDCFYLNKLIFKYALKYDFNQPFAFDHVEVYIIQDTQCNGSVPDMADVFTTPAAVVAGTRLRSIDQMKRYKILHSFRTTLGNGGTTWDVAGDAIVHSSMQYPGKTFVKRWKGSGLKIQVVRGSPTGSLSTLLDNNIFVVMKSLHGNTDVTWSIRSFITG